MSTFKSSLFDNLRKLITVIDELRDVGVSDYIQLPRICVLGTQSAGKSSLLENIVGLDFLPRGEGVVTRRPLELRLVHTFDQAGKPWGVFDVMKDKKFYNFDEVREQINIITDRDAGTRKGIITDPIKLTIYSPDCPDLTIIDLPGITRIPLANSDQPDNIEEITKELAQSYCKEERTIILCVMPANQDMSTQDALAMAKKMDPHGERTLGVLTKIDIMNPGSDAKKMLSGQEIELRLGFVGVKNRSQLDINSKMRVEAALALEDEFFRTHKVYSAVPKEQLGTRALVEKLSTIFFKHIRKSLPKIMDEIDAKVVECDDKIRRMGPSLPVEQKDRVQILYNMLIDYTETFKNIMRGKYDSTQTSQDNEKTLLTGGAKIKREFNKLYDDLSGKEYKVTKIYSDKDIDRAITLHQGDSIPGFPSIDSFLYLIIPRIQELRDPAMEVLNETFVYMDQLATTIIKRVFMRFPSVLDEISDLSNKVLQLQRDKAKRIIDNQLDSELDYIFTNDHQYLSSKTDLTFQQQSKIEPKQVLQKELRSRVDAYYRLVIRNLRDSIPKIIGHFMVKVSQDYMQLHLYNEMMKNQNIMSSLEEPAYLKLERETIMKTLVVLKKAQKMMKKDQNLTLTYEERTQLKSQN